MRILVAVKRVPITGGKMVLTDDEQAIQTRHLGFTISPHEECGVEEAVRIVETHGGEVVVITLGPAEAEDQLRECMALGADRAIHLVTEEEWDAQATASALLAVIREEAPFDLIVFGNESADAGNYQVGIRVAYALGLPVVTGLKGLTIDDDRARCEQEVPGGRDVYDVSLPAVVTVSKLVAPHVEAIACAREVRDEQALHTTVQVMSWFTTMGFVLHAVSIHPSEDELGPGVKVRVSAVPGKTPI